MWDAAGRLTFKAQTSEPDRQKALDAGLMWAGITFVSGAEAAEANFFLDFVNPGPDTLVVLGYRTDPGRHDHRTHTAPGIETGKRDKFNGHLNGLKKLRA